MRRCFWVLVAVGAICVPASGQRGAGRASGLPGSSVQRPSLSTFTSSTSVSVPDSAAGVQAGMRQMAVGKGGGVSRAGQVGVKVQIHDMAAMEREILSRGAAVAGAAGAGTAPRGQVGTAERPAMSVAEARRLRQAAEDSSREEALVLVERARAAEAGGKPGVAKIYYQMAARRASGELRQEILTRLEALPHR